MINTKLPYDNELEDSVLGAVIQDNDTYDKVAKYFNNLEVFGQEVAQDLWNNL